MENDLKDCNSPSIFEAVRSIHNSTEHFVVSEPSDGLSKIIRSCENANERSEWILGMEKRRFGGNPLPWEPGGDQYFRSKT